MGTVTTDGGVYDLYRIWRVPSPAIHAAPWFLYLSVRQTRRTSGRITMANHFDAWVRAGATFGPHDYTLLATEAYQSPGGSSAVTISSAPQPAAADAVSTGRVTKQGAAPGRPTSSKVLLLQQHRHRSLGDQ